MPAAGTPAVPPPMLWAQRSDMLIVTIAAECKDEEYKFTEDTMHFKATGVQTDRAYEVTLNFADKIDPEQVTTKKTAQCNLQFQIMRKTPGPYWNSLTTDKKKPHFLKIDFNLWVDESQEDDDEGGMPGGMGGGMPPGMGGMGGMGGLGGAGGDDMMKYMNMFGQQQGGADSKHMFDDLDEAEDSDDEELPNLE